MRRQVFFVSDSPGMTAETPGNALPSQFDHVELETTTIPFALDASASSIEEFASRVLLRTGSRRHAY